MGAAARSTFMRIVPALALLSVWRACAETGAGAVRARGPRSSADDSELWNLIPGDSDAVADVDLAALRASPWSRALMEGSLDGEREERRQRFGYDVFTEAERMLVAGAEAAGGTNTLTIARGRFDAERVASAFLARHAGRGRDAVAGQLAVGGAGAGGRAGHAAHDRAGGRPARAGVDRRGVGRGGGRGRGPARRDSPRAGRGQESARGHDRDLGDRRHACPCRRGCSPCRTGCGGSARG